MFKKSLDTFVGCLPLREVRADGKNVRAELTALINDTTGTLIASNYVDPHTKIAVIFGTGCNAAYMETAENIPKMASVGLPHGQGMAINVSPYLNVTDDSANGEHSTHLSTNISVGVCSERKHALTSARTKYDIIIDESSNKPGEQVGTDLICVIHHLICSHSKR